jgi:OmpA-OmpF porin, OOP family
MKTICTLFISFCCLTTNLLAQPLPDTTVKLKEQKENIITTNTIVKIENLGELVNTGYPEMRPTILFARGILLMCK